MIDIFERLRVPPGPGQTITQNYRMMVEERAEAADEIERLFIMTEMRGQEIERLTAALAFMEKRALRDAREIERLNKDGAELAAIIRQQGFEIMRLTAALQQMVVEAAPERKT